MAKTNKTDAQVFLENIVRNIPQYTFWKDKNSVYLGCNDNYARLIGFKSPQDIIGKTDLDIYGDAAELFRQGDRETMAGKYITNQEEWMSLPSGKKILVLVNKAPILDEHNNVLGVLGVATDITEKKRIDQELAETKHRLEGMTLVSSIIAHELRTPLAAINLGAKGTKSYLPDLIDAYKLASEANLPVNEIRSSQLDLIFSAMDRIISETNYSNIIINMLLTNVNQQKINEADFSPCSISQCINEALQRYPFQTEEKALVQFDNSIDFNFMGKEILTVHIFFNLLKNAIYYVKAANKGNIQIWLEKDVQYNKVHFKDTGKGIPSDVLPRIFELFFSKTYHGFGIGLAFCKMVMESYGGKIECNSIEGEFTEFILSFPALA